MGLVLIPLLVGCATFEPHERKKPPLDIPQAYELYREGDSSVGAWWHVFENPELKALTGILLALSLVGWVTLARVVRGQVLQVKQMTYVEAARALGANPFWIVVKHVFPNILGPIIVLLTFQIPDS